MCCCVLRLFLSELGLASYGSDLVVWEGSKDATRDMYVAGFFSTLVQKLDQIMYLCNGLLILQKMEEIKEKWTTLYPVMVLTCRRGIFHRTLKAVQFMVSNWMSNGGLSRSEGAKRLWV